MGVGLALTRGPIGAAQDMLRQDQPERNFVVFQNAFRSHGTPFSLSLSKATRDQSPKAFNP